MYLSLSIPWAQLDLPSIAVQVIDNAMDKAFKKFLVDTYFYDPETREAHAQQMGQIQKRLHLMGHLKTRESFNFSGEYTGKHARHPKHLRDSWVGYNIVQGDLILFNTSPAAYYLYNGNSPDGGGGYITPTQGSYMTFFLRTGLGGPGWRHARKVRSVEQTGKMTEFRQFLTVTIQRSVYEAIAEFELPSPDEEYVGDIDDLAPQDIMGAIYEEVQGLTYLAKGAYIDWKTAIKYRAGIKPSSADWEIWSSAVGRRWAELDEIRRERKRKMTQFRRMYKTLKDSGEEFVYKRRERVAKKQTETGKKARKSSEGPRKLQVENKAGMIDSDVGGGKWGHGEEYKILGGEGKHTRTGLKLTKERLNAIERLNKMKGKK